MLALNSLLAWAVNLLNFMVTKATSALTLQVLGNAKGVVAALVSVLVFRNPVSVVGCGGYLVTVAGVYGYSEVCPLEGLPACFACLIITSMLIKRVHLPDWFPHPMTAYN